MSPDALLSGLADGGLAPARFDHRAHLQVARELLLRYGPDAGDRFCGLVLGYVRGLGAEDKFHRTVSLALMRLVAARMRPGESWEAFCIANPELFTDARGLLAGHYSSGRLALGRQAFVEPDLQPLP